MKAIIIAECCQNHNGDTEILKQQIYEAAKSGADYVKIQAIRSSELTNRSRFNSGKINKSGETTCIKRPFREEYERLKKLDLNLEQEYWFANECKKVGIAPMITAFSINSLHEVKDFGFEAIKIASYDCASLPLIKEAKKYWSNIFISTGATFDDEIEKTASLLQDKPFYFLHCTTIYPTPLEKLDLRRMDFLRKFTNKVGYSDHTNVENTGITASKIALALGSSCIERHFTVLKSNESKDGPVSINPKQLNELVNFSKLSRYEMIKKIEVEHPNWSKTLGEMTRELSKEELLNRDYYRGRFASNINNQIVYNWEFNN